LVRGGIPPYPYPYGGAAHVVVLAQRVAAVLPLLCGGVGETVVITVRDIWYLVWGVSPLMEAAHAVLAQRVAAVLLL